MGIGYVLSIVGIAAAGLVNSIARENQRKNHYYESRRHELAYHQH